MARKATVSQDSIVEMFQAGRTFRLQAKHRYTLMGLSQAERKAFHDGWAYEEQALRTGNEPEMPVEYNKEFAV